MMQQQFFETFELVSAMSPGGLDRMGEQLDRMDNHQKAEYALRINVTLTFTNLLVTGQLWVGVRAYQCQYPLISADHPLGVCE